MRRDVTERLCRALDAGGLDAVVCLSPENFAYAAGFVVPSQPLMRWRHAAWVVRRDGSEAVLCVDMEETTVRGVLAERGWDDVPVHVWSEFGGEAMTGLAVLLGEMGLADATVAVERDFLPVAAAERLRELAPRVRLVDAGPLLERTRQVKTAEELALLRRLSRAADGAIRAAFDAVRAGDTEMDLAAALTRGVFERGAGQYKLMIVATGERSELPNVGPTARVLRPGDVCRVEIFAVDQGYQAGVCRTAVVGEPSAQVSRIYATLERCRTLVLDAARPGVPAHHVYDVFRSEFDSLGLPAISFVGHSLGADLHETPYLAPGVTAPLETGMVLGVEPLVYRSGLGFGIQIKDVIAIGTDGAEVLSDVTPVAEPYRIPA